MAALSSFFGTVKELFFRAKNELPSSCELEIFASTGRGRSLLWAEKKCERVSEGEGGGVGLRVILNNGRTQGQQGYAFTTNFSKESLEKTAHRALEAAKSVPGDPFREMPVAANSAVSVNDSGADPALFSEGVPGLQESLRRGEAELLKKYPLLKSILRAGFSEGFSEVVILNSKGIEKNFIQSHCSLGVSCLAEKDGERQEGGFGQSKRFKSDLKWEETFEKAAQRTIALLGGKPIPSGAVPVVFDPSVGAEFLSLFADALCADSVQKGKSFLKGNLNEQVASEWVTLVDDGTLKNGLATSPVDDEGIPTQRTLTIEKGKLTHYLYDTYTAAKDQTRSTGNASRAGFRSSPSPGPSNFYLQAGTVPREKLLRMTRGLYLYEVMGLHMADPISGDFSVGAIGAWLENGEFKSAVRGITLAGNLLELVKNVDAVCEDLTFFGSVGSPTFRVSELMVSGQ